MNIKNSIAALTLVAVAALGLTGCGGVDKAASPAPEASVAAPVSEQTPEPAVETPSNVVEFGGVYTWENGVSISVSAPSEFVASEYAMGATPGQAQVVFTFVLTNGSTEPLEPMTFPTAASGGTEAASIYDSGNPLGEIGSSPSTSVLPGKTVQWLVAYSVADINDIIVEVSPGFEYQNAIFTNNP
jgi:hypothetical protein